MEIADGVVVCRRFERWPLRSQREMVAYWVGCWRGNGPGNYPRRLRLSKEIQVRALALRRTMEHWLWLERLREGWAEGVEVAASRAGFSGWLLGLASRARLSGLARSCWKFRICRLRKELKPEKLRQILVTIWADVYVES